MSRTDTISAVAKEFYTRRACERVGIDTIDDLTQELWVKSLECGLEGALLRVSLRNWCHDKLRDSRRKKRYREHVGLDSVDSEVAYISEHDRKPWQEDRVRLYHPYKQRCKPVNESAVMARLRAAGYNPRHEEFIYPGIGRESMIWILKSGTYNNNVRFEDDALYIEGDGQDAWPPSGYCPSPKAYKRSTSPVEQSVGYSEWVTYGGLPPFQGE